MDVLSTLGPRSRTRSGGPTRSRPTEPAGILIFDDVADAPLGGRQFGSYPGGRFFVVLDSDELNPLTLEVAYHQARTLAVASVDGDAGTDAKWLISQCDAIAKLIEDAREIKNGANAARRGLDRVDTSYEQLRTEALVILDEVKAKLT